MSRFAACGLAVLLFTAGAALAQQPGQQDPAPQEQQTQQERQVTQPGNNAPVWREVQSGEPNYTSIEGYVAARVIVDALRRLGGRPTRDGLISTLEGLSGYESRGYHLHFGPTKHVGSSFVELSMLTADGKVRR